MGWTSWYLCYLIEPVSEYLSGPSLYVEWTNWSKQNWEVTQICIPLLVVGSLSTKVILKRSPPLVSAGILVFVEYMSGPSLYVEWTNWSKILASYSDMYTSPGNR